MNNLLSCFIQEEKFYPKTLGGEVEVTLRELTIDENTIVQNVTINAIIQAVGTDMF